MSSRITNVRLSVCVSKTFRESSVLIREQSIIIREHAHKFTQLELLKLRIVSTKAQIIFRFDMTMQNIENTLEKCLKIEHLEFMKFYDDKLSLKYEI